MTDRDNFISALDEMVGAKARNARKNVPVISWFEKTFTVRARAAVVNAANQSYNRVNEQFAHGDAHIVFVVTDPKAVKGIRSSSLGKWFEGLESVFIVERDAVGGYGPAVLLKAKDSPVTNFFESEFSPIDIESVSGPLGSAGGAVKAVADSAEVTWTEGLAKEPLHLIGVKQAYLSALAALQSGKHVVFYGPPGTGKTELAKVVCQNLGVRADLCTATSDWTTFETLGGYFPIVDSEETSTGTTMDFSPGVVTRSLEKGKWLIIDELNRADVDKAFGELFTLLAGADVRLPHRKNDGGEYKEIQFVHEGSVVDESAFSVVVPKDWRIIGTLNTFDKASLYQLSYAFMRRFAFIEVSVPQDDKYSSLIAEASKGIVGVPADSVERVLAAITTLFAESGPYSLASAGIRIGPSVALDCLRVSATMLRSSLFAAGEEGERLALLEAASALLFPQFEGREREHGALFDAICGSLKLEAGERAVAERRLSAWTGVAV